MWVILLLLVLHWIVLLVLHLVQKFNEYTFFFFVFFYKVLHFLNMLLMQSYSAVWTEEDLDHDMVKLAVMKS